MISTPPAKPLAVDRRTGVEIDTSGEDDVVPRALSAPVSRVEEEREAEAIAHVRHRRPDVALKVLMVVYGDALAGFIARLIRDPARTRAIYRDVFLRAFRGIHKFRRREHNTMWSWLCQITYERFVEEERQSARSGTGIARDASQEDEAAAVVSSASAPPSSVMDDDALMVERCVAELPVAVRAQLLMRFLLGLSDAEIAKVTGIDAAIVDLNIVAATARLRTCLGTAGGGP